MTSAQIKALTAYPVQLLNMLHRTLLGEHMPSKCYLGSITTVLIMLATAVPTHSQTNVTTPSGSNNAIPYFTGSYALGNSSVVFNPSNGYVGVGIAYPSYTLDVNGDTNTSGQYRMYGSPVIFADPMIPDPTGPSPNCSSANSEVLPNGTVSYLPTDCVSIPVPVSSFVWGWSGDAVDTLNPALLSGVGTWKLQCGAITTYSPGLEKPLFGNNGYPVWQSTGNPILVFN